MKHVSNFNQPTTQYVETDPEHVAEHDGSRCKCQKHSPSPFHAPTKAKSIADGEFMAQELKRDVETRKEWGIKSYVDTEYGDTFQPYIEPHFCTRCGNLLGFYQPKPFVKTNHREKDHRASTSRS